MERHAPAESRPPLARRAGWARRIGLSRPDAGRLGAARLAFAEALDDVRTAAAFTLQAKVGVARSMHELWHLRGPAFDLIALRHSQAEATRRLAALDRLFSA